MILYPAIDLKEGACVRLRQGDMDRATVFGTDPAAQARAFAAAGFEWIHVVDLDGAVSGQPGNTAAVRAILDAVAIPIQLGGGIRDLAAIEAWLAAGVRRVVLGTAAVDDPELVRAAARRYPGRIVVGIDAREGQVAVEGWAREARISALELALGFETAGAAAIVYTDIERDGMLTGPNIDATAALAAALTTPVIASGGVSSLDDLAALLAVAGTGIEGAIVGRALYDGRVEPREALTLFGRAAAAQC